MQRNVGSGFLLHDKDSTKQGFGIHASWIPCFVLYCVNLHLAWPGDPNAAWQVSCCCTFLARALKTDVNKNRRERCWRRSEHTAAHLSVVVETLREELQEKRAAAVFSGDLNVFFWRPKTQQCLTKVQRRVKWQRKSMFSAHKVNDSVCIENRAFHSNGPAADISKWIQQWQAH